MEFFVRFGGLREALVYGIRFQGNLVIPDIFVFISTHMAELLLRDYLSRNFIVYAIRGGDIIPAFRSDSGGNFRAALEMIRKPPSIQGLHPDADQIAALLDEGIGIVISTIGYGQMSR